jgi:hypothetical protein
LQRLFAQLSSNLGGKIFFFFLRAFTQTEADKFFQFDVCAALK